jgi:hypothetical protein
MASTLYQEIFEKGEAKGRLDGETRGLAKGKAEQRVHGTVLHVDILGDKLWIQYDGTARPIAEALVQAGVPQDHSVLGFQPPDMRPHTGFATG